MHPDGWYLISTDVLLRELARFRAGEELGGPLSDVQPLTIEEALAYRDSGNLPDDHGRSLRLVLSVSSEEELHSLEARRLTFEPDYLGAPDWRREGSKPINVVPLRSPGVKGVDRAWWEDAAVAPLEKEWQEAGTVAGMPVPGEFRSFIFKTVIALRAADLDVTPEAVLDGVARWLSPSQVGDLRAAFDRVMPS